MNSDDKDNQKQASRPATKGRRFMKLAGMSASVASRYAGNQFKRAFQSQERRDSSRSEYYAKVGEEIAGTLGELKGAVMKVGQIASQAKDLLPEEISGALTQLQREAPPMEFSVIEEQVSQSLNGPLDELFSTFDRAPYAAASIGQVHRAVTHSGQEVVVKVQYPGVREAVDSDLNHLRFALRASRLLKVKKGIADDYFREIRERILEELDYVNEAANLNLFREFHARHDSKIVIPKVVDALSSHDVLTLTFEAGDHIGDEALEHYDQEQINAIGRRLFHAMGREIFELKAVHGDPHPGNFAFRSDGSVVMYDFGCIKKLDPHVVDHYRHIVIAGLEGDYEALDQHLIKLGGRIASGPSVEDEYYDLWREIFLRPFFSNGPFDFAASTMHEDVVKNIPSAMKRMNSFQPVVGTAFIDRAVSGHYQTMRSLGVKANFSDDLYDVLALGAGA
ncbi:ABC-1 domain protein [gamma proteobacterium HTCC5015]|nr:ABC-1 domain protein [gamma proteobacterium HTCC5015]